MKKNISEMIFSYEKLALLILFALIFLFNGFLYAEDKKQELSLSGKVMENGIRVRQDKNISAQILGNLYKGEKINILERSKEKEKIQDMEEYWYKIEYQGKYGWVYGFYLIAEEAIENLKGTINSDNVHIRKDFGLGTEVISKIFKNDVFPVVAKTNKELVVETQKNYWYKIQLPDKTYGWVFGDFIDVSTQK